MIYQRFILILALVYSSTVFSQDAIQNVFSIKKQPAKTHLIETFSDYLGNETTLPIAIFQGKEDGPIVTIVAGIHGFEYPPIVATQELMKEIDPERLRGTLLFIPIANKGSFYSRTPFLNPLDKKNLNGVFPGKKEVQ